MRRASMFRKPQEVYFEGKIFKKLNKISRWARQDDLSKQYSWTDLLGDQVIV